MNRLSFSLHYSSYILYTSACICSFLILVIISSEWVVKIPIILIMGVATTTDAPRNTLSSNALQYLSPTKFILRSPAERLDAIIEAVLVKQCSGFYLGHKVALFLRNCFLRQDGTLTSFIRALKVRILFSANFIAKRYIVFALASSSCCLLVKSDSFNTSYLCFWQMSCRWPLSNIYPQSL